MIRHPVNKWIDSCLRCTKCNAKFNECDCWTLCNCGWFIEKNHKCKNPKCLTSEGEVGMDKDYIIDKLKTTVQDLLEACDAPFPDSCDCGGADTCAICNAYRLFKELDYIP